MFSAPWPSTAEFSRMLQNPRVAFRDARLQQCVVEKNALGQPKPRSGNFATVYRGDLPDGRVEAIRVFNRRLDQRRERYEAVSRYLEGRQVNSLVGFTFDEKGIRVAESGKLQPFPLLVMDWVPGVTLLEWAREHCRTYYRDALRLGAEAWLQLVRELTAHTIVHGDLQHANVLVSDEGYFKLVDYDCMGVPELMGSCNVEVGLPPYQHPARNAETPLFAGLDNFSALVIYVALRALAAEPGLWKHYVTALNNDNLLFHPSDFAAPDDSLLYRDLQRSPDEQVRDLSYYLYQLTIWPLREIPPVDEVLLWCSSLGEVLSQRDWDLATRLVQRMSGREAIPAELMPQVAEAQRRVACREALEQALASGDEAEITRCYQPELLADYPAAAPLVAEARKFCESRRTLEELEFARQAGDWALFKSLWQVHESTVAVLSKGRPYQEEWERLQAAETLLTLLNDPSADQATLADAWATLQSRGGHPLVEQSRAEIERRLAPCSAGESLRDLLLQSALHPGYEIDSQVAKAWQAHGGDNDPNLADLLPNYEAARRRIRRLNKLNKLGLERTLQGERQVVARSWDLPADYHPRLRPRIEKALLRLSHWQDLQNALREPMSDQAAVGAWNALLAVDGSGMISEQDRVQITVSTRRLELIQTLHASLELTPDERDSRFLQLWDPRLLEGRLDAEPLAQIYRQACARLQI
jgi:serine/threonine protein kinase